MRTGPIAIVLLVAVACLGGCGSGGGGGSGDDPLAPPMGPVDTFDRRLNRDPAGAELSIFPVMCCDGQRVYVAWYDRRNGGLDIYFNRSLDGGLTWLATDIRLDSGVAGSASSLIPQICCSGANVYVAWYDERNGLSDIYFNRSLDSGSTWLAQDVRLDTDPAGAARSREPALCCSGSRVHVAWHDLRGGTWDIYSNASLDGGATWLVSDLRVDRGSNNRNAEFAQLACFGSTVYCAWADDRSGGSSVRFSRSVDGGVTWPATDVLLNNQDAAGVPTLVTSGTHVHVAWSDTRSGRARLRYNRSINAGADWLATDLAIDASTGDATNASLCADGAELFVVWQDTRSGAADIYFQRTRDAGATWLLSDVRLDQDLPGVSASWAPRIACDQQALHVVWRDDRHGRFDILLAHSPDRGVRWSTPEVRLDTDAPGAAHSVAPQVCALGVQAVVAWYDERHGSGDIYVNHADFAP